MKGLPCSKMIKNYASFDLDHHDSNWEKLSETESYDLLCFVTYVIIRQFELNTQKQDEKIFFHNFIKKVREYLIKLNRASHKNLDRNVDTRNMELRFNTTESFGSIRQNNFRQLTYFDLTVAQIPPYYLCFYLYWCLRDATNLLFVVPYKKDFSKTGLRRGDRINNIHREFIKSLDEFVDYLEEHVESCQHLPEDFKRKSVKCQVQLECMSRYQIAIKEGEQLKRNNW